MLNVDKRTLLRAGLVSLGAALLGPAVSAQVAPVAPAVGTAPDPRVAQRQYRFSATGEEIPYAVFVSSKVRAGAPAPLIVALHGLNGNHNTLMRGPLLDLAEQGGFVVVSPMGYNPRGWYGIPGEYSPRAGIGRPPSPAAANDPPNLRALSEQDVLEVVALARKEFAIDPRRNYLVGHSMGGAGAMHLASKYPDQWAAVAAIAPATRRMVPRMQGVLSTVEAPVFIVQGLADPLVPVDMTRTWIDALEERRMVYDYKEIAGADHRSVIDLGMPDVFGFLAGHTRN